MSGVLKTLAAASIVFMIGVVTIILPAIDEVVSARAASRQIKAHVLCISDPVYLYVPGWPMNEDLTYYLTFESAVKKIPSEQGLIEVMRASGSVLFLSDMASLTALRERGHLSLTMLREFSQPRGKGLCLMVGREKAKSEKDDGRDSRV